MQRQEQIKGTDQRRRSKEQIKGEDQSRSKAPIRETTSEGDERSRLEQQPRSQQSEDQPR
jgi:hypothetical protein